MNHERARDNMIEQQIRPWNVFDQTVLDTIAAVPRDVFVAPQYANFAYCDTAISLGHGQFMLTPNVEGRLLQTLALRGGESVLHIGTGSGYLTACLAKLARHAHSVDSVPDFTQVAVQRLAGLSIDNVTLETGDACNGWAQEKRFDAIIISGALPLIPNTYRTQLTIGGRLFAIVGEHGQPIMEAQLVTREGRDRWCTESLFETCTSYLVNSVWPSKFTF